MHCGFLLVIKKKKGKREEAAGGTFWRITAIDRENRLRLGRVLAKTESDNPPEQHLWCWHGLATTIHENMPIIAATYP
jgi:hypothetical protein